MTTENIETKAVETVAETVKEVADKEVITNILAKGVEHKFAIIFGAAAGTGAACFAVSVLVKKVKKARAKKDEGTDIQETLEAAGEALRNSEE